MFDPPPPAAGPPTPPAPPAPPTPPSAPPTPPSGSATSGEENAVTKLLKQISGDITDRTCEQKELSEQAKSLEIRKIIREEIERQKKSPAAKIKADYAQAKREELMKFTIETAKQALPSEDELAKDPAFLGKVKAKLSKDQADKFDQLFKDSYPDLYKIQTDKDKSDGSQGAKWIWPSFVTKDQKTKIIDMIKANKDIKLNRIADELKFSSEQKKEFLDKSWQKGIKDSILKGKTEPETTSVSGSTTIAWPTGVTDEQKKQILEEVKSERDPGKVLPKIVGLSDDLKSEIRKIWRDILPPKPKKGGATIRRPLKGGRTVRHV